MKVIIKIKDIYADNNFNKLVTKIPPEYSLTFSLLWNDFLNLDDIVSLTDNDFENIVRRHKPEVQKVMRDCYYAEGDDINQTLKDLIVRNFYDIVFTESDDSDEVTYEVKSST